MSFYTKDESILPIRAAFNSKKYKSKVPMPSVDTFVAIEGLLIDVQTDDNGLSILFNISVQDISFLGKTLTRSPHCPTMTKNASNSIYAGARRICQQADGVRGVPWVRPTRVGYGKAPPWGPDGTIHVQHRRPKGLAIARWHSTLGNAWLA